MASAVARAYTEGQKRVCRTGWLQEGPGAESPGSAGILLLWLSLLLPPLARYCNRTGRFIANRSIRTLTTDLTLISSSSRRSTIAAAERFFDWYKDPRRAGSRRKADDDDDDNCVNGDWLCQLEMAIFDPIRNRHLSTGHQKICRRWLSRRPLQLCQIRCISVRGGLLGTFVKYNQNYFYLYTFLRNSPTARVRPVDRFSRMMAQNDADSFTWLPI